MSDQTLLSNLCSVWYVNKNGDFAAKHPCLDNIKESKYKCPGCSARTCSLPCVKRHKQWAQCSGKRDPTKYMKKSELATPAGIDHDYNFLSGIERDLEKSEKSVTEKGLDIDLNTKSKGDRAQGIDYHLAAAGVKVIRAPKGMSRSKENKTHRSKSGNRNIIWTVEWIGEDKTRTLTQSSAVELIYRLHPLHESPSTKKKRKRDMETSSLPDEKPTQSDTTPQKDQGSSQSVEPSQETSKPPPSATETLTASTTTQPPQPDTTTSSPLQDQRYTFYLFRPRTSSTRRVLIPISSSSTLGDALRTRTVEEFPTIYYFPSTTLQLPDEFVLDDQYRREEGEQQREFDEMMRDVDPEILKRLREDGPGSKGGEEVDSKRILDVLKQDLGAL